MVNHNRNAKYVKNLESEANVTNQEKVDVTKESLKKILGRMPNWEFPGPDSLQGFRLENLGSAHGRVRSQFKEFLEGGFVPTLLTKGRNTLLQKNKSKGYIASNYRPITCLPLIWKLLMGVIASQNYGHLDQKKILPEKQKGCRTRSRGTNDLL